MTPHQLTKRIVDLQHDIDLMGSNHTNSMIRIKLEEARLYVHLIEAHLEIPVAREGRNRPDLPSASPHPLGDP